MKVHFSSVLNDDLKSPFGLADFREFVRKEHSAENLEFYERILAYRDKAHPIFPSTNLRSRLISSSSASMAPSMHSTSGLQPLASSASTTGSQGLASITETGGGDSGGGGGGGGMPATPPLSPGNGAGREDENKLRETLLKEMETMVKTFLTVGAEKEVNLPAAVRKRIVEEVEERKNLHPDVFRSALEQTYLMMKTSSYPSFYKQAVTTCARSNKPLGEKKVGLPPTAEGKAAQ